MKTTNVQLSEELHKKLKHYAVEQERPVTRIIVELIEKELEAKK